MKLRTRDSDLASWLVLDWRRAKALRVTTAKAPWRDMFILPKAMRCQPHWLVFVSIAITTSKLRGVRLNTSQLG